MWTLIVRSHGRWDYLQRCLDQLDGNFADLFDRKVLALDGCNTSMAPEWEVVSSVERTGLAANLARAWGALTADDDWVFDVEEDFLVGPVDLEAAADLLRVVPRVCRMTLVRQPWSPPEVAAGSMLAGSPHLAGKLTQHDGWIEQDSIFSLNPSVAHADRLRELTPGVESDLTAQAVQNGYTFGFWGEIDDPPRCLHIGERDGMGSAGWRAS